jgi:transformer-2 protein
VFGLDFKMTAERLRKEFGQYGTIEALHKIPQKNYAFVYYETIESATQAKRMMNGLKLGERVIRVDYSTTDKSHESIK